MMSRQQLVFKNTSELVHIWANQAQDEGYSSNMSFRTRCMFSDSMMIASLRGDDVIFLNNISSISSRSSTTNRHQKAVRSACSDFTVVEYNSIPNWCEGEVARLHADPAFIEPLDIWEQYRDIWRSLLASASEKRFNRTASQRLALANEYAEKANSIAMLFTLEDCYPLTAAYFRLLHPVYG